MTEAQETALQKCIDWINENYKPVGIIASGSIIRGGGNMNSDFDIFVIHEEKFRQRIQKYFDNVPVEIFINNLSHVEKYFEDDYKSNRPITAHMIGTGKIIKGGDKIEIQELKETAQSYLSKKPEVNERQRVIKKYMISSCFEDALDMKHEDIATSTYFIHKVLSDLVDFIFWDNEMQLPRYKERLKTLNKLFPETGKYIRAAYESKSYNELVENAEQVMKLTNIQKGFFEWNSPQE